MQSGESAAKSHVRTSIMLLLLLSLFWVFKQHSSYTDLMKFKKENEGVRPVPAENWPLAFRHEYRYIGKKKYVPSSLVFFFF